MAIKFFCALAATFLTFGAYADGSSEAEAWNRRMYHRVLTWSRGHGGLVSYQPYYQGGDARYVSNFEFTTADGYRCKGDAGSVECANAQLNKQFLLVGEWEYIRKH